MQSHLASILMLLITMVIWGSTFVVTKGVNDLVPPFTLAFVRVAIGALVLLAFALIRQARGGSHSPWSALPWGTMISMGLIGVVLYYAVFNYSLVYTSASQGALVQSCIPAMTALVAVVWLREHASALRWAGIALSMVGVLIVFSGAERSQVARQPARQRADVRDRRCCGACTRRWRSGSRTYDPRAWSRRASSAPVRDAVAAAGSFEIAAAGMPSVTCEAGSAWRISAPAHPASPTCCTAQR